MFISLKEKNLKNLCVWVLCLYVCYVCAPNACLVLAEARRVIQISWKLQMGITDGCELPWRCWELNLQPRASGREPSLQALLISFWHIFVFYLLISISWQLYLYCILSFNLLVSIYLILVIPVTSNGYAGCVCVSMCTCVCMCACIYPCVCMCLSPPVLVLCGPYILVCLSPYVSNYFLHDSLPF